MKDTKARILCVGQESGLLSSRCAVLNHGGYAACSLSPAHAELLLNMLQSTLPSVAGDFDLVITSTSLTEAQRIRITAAAGLRPIINLTGVTRATDLLTLVSVALLKTVINTESVTTL
jgi:hypothetical protein